MFELENTFLWDSVRVTDPSKTKKIVGKDYQGTSTRPHWLAYRCTEVFGPCGQGWGIIVKDQGFEVLDQENKLHWCIVQVWYIQNGQRCTVEHMGATKAMYRTSEKDNQLGKMKYDEDAPKKSVTDAFVKAISLIGFSGDILSGLWDKPGYQEFAAEYHAQYNAQKDEAINRKRQEMQEAMEPKEVVESPAPQQEILDSQERDKALRLVGKAKNRNDLNAIYANYKHTPLKVEVYQACMGKKQKEGWLDS